ncbi:MAG: hypothetical protein HOP23_03510 [Methylococcaceae bacterium]|nr:hypothetical protein [Methylococcaceae bacterium]
MHRIIWLLLLVSFLNVPYINAKPLARDQVPEPLKPWVDWVLQDHPDLACPYSYNSFEQKRCSWPSQLHMELSTAAGQYTASWKVYRESWVRLPGDSKHWPLNVSVNGKPAVVMDKNGVPFIQLAAGNYQIKGEFVWDGIPDTLSIPDDSGLIELSINGVTIVSPAIRDGQLWLKESEIGQKKPENIQNNLDLQVFRQITDDVPLQVLTHLDLEVSGEQREVRLTLPMLPGFQPLQVQSQIPARLEADGALLVQVRPGRWQIDVLSRALTDLQTIPFNVIAPGPTNESTAYPWPQSEIWVFDARPHLRVVEIEQLSAIDPSQTNLPDHWKSMPAYKINQGQTMAFKVIRRGDPEPEPNQLTLTRQLWLDFNGKGYTVNDKISGKMTHGWRLNVLAAMQLGKVTLDGINQLITEQANTGKQGVEVRKGMIALDADSRIIGTIGAISAVGWEQNFHAVSAELNLPPGWRLLLATGVDNVPDSWVSRWTLLDIFIVLIAALAIGRLWNVYWGLFTLLTLTLTWHEPGFPHFVWLNILVATALIKVLPANIFLTFMTWFRNACWLALVIMVLPFMVDQVRMGLYPQLEKPWQAVMQSDTVVSKSAPPNVADMAAVEGASDSDELMATPMSQEYQYFSSVGDMAKISRPGSGNSDFERIDPKAKVQTGPGLPQWQWTKILLSWNGSVDAQQQLNLWYQSPKLTMVLNFSRVVLVSILSLLLFGVAEKLTFKMTSMLPLFLVFVLMPMLSLKSNNAYADFPDQVMLDNLRNKLLAAPDCLPDCAQIAQMNLEITDKELSITLQIHAQQSVAVPLPANYEQWFPSQVSVDGVPAQGLFRNINGLWINLGAGEHAVVLRGVTPLLGKFTLPLPLKPHRATVESTGWQVTGTQENGLVDNNVQFIRAQTDQQESKKMLDTGSLPPFVRIERTLQLGLDWRVMTQVIRVSPPDSAIVLAVPLLTGESVSSEGIRVKDGRVEVNMPGNQATVTWASTLEKSEKIDLLAASSEQWVEVWKVDVSPIWHMASEGLAVIHLTDESQWLPEWHPWPGEKVTLHLSRPEPVDGQSLTIDGSRLTIRPGQRTEEAELKLSLRSAQGMQHTLVLPEHAKLQSVIIDGQARPIRQEGQKLTLPLNPGKQEVTISWQEAVAMSTVLTTPPVNLGVNSVNVSLNIGLGQDRWVLFTMGPQFGPAVLFWGVLIVITLVSIGLGKVRMTPLKSWQWFLLLVGLSQIPIESAVLVVGWLVLLGWRASLTSKARYFNAVQIILVCLTIASLGQLFFAVSQGLLGSPDMQIVGNQSNAYSLRWYQDISASIVPTATVISLPLMAYRLLMLAWSLWLAVALLNWLKWGWKCFSSDGLWIKKATEGKSR